MKKSLLWALVVGLAVPAFAQDGGIQGASDSHECGRGRRGHRGPRLEEMREELQLTDEQVTRMRALHESRRAEGRPARQEDHQSFRAAMDQILTPAQRQMLAAKRREHGERRLSRMTTDLQLSAAQVQQIRAIFQREGSDFHGDREAVMAVLSPEQRQRMQTLRQEHGDRAGHGRGRH